MTHGFAEQHGGGAVLGPQTPRAGGLPDSVEPSRKRLHLGREQVINVPLLIVIVSQLLFTAEELLAGQHTRGDFAVANFLTGWFAAYLLLRSAATFGQLYVLSMVELGKTMALFGAASVMIANVLGWLVLQEVLPPISYVGIGLAVLALAVMGWR